MGMASSKFTMYNEPRERHVNSYLHTIIQYIKEFDRPVPFEEIERKTMIRLIDNKKVLEALKKNSKVKVNRDSLLFKPVYNIRSEDDLFQLMEQTECKYGIEMEKLLESPVDVRVFVENLKKKEQIFILKDTDNSEILFLNRLKIEPVDEKIKALWDEIPVLNYPDIIKELSSAGIKVEQKFYEEKKNIVKKKNKVKKFKRRIKITNTHVKGLNLNDLDQ